jgi:HlyD family secretion protein
MDMPRDSAKRQRRIRGIIYSAVGLLAIARLTYGLSSLKPDEPLEASAVSYPGNQGLPSQAGGQTEPEISRDSISIHEVQRGNMPLRLMGNGEIVSITPPQALVRVSAPATPPPQIGQKVSVQIKPPAVLVGKVVDVDRAGESGFTKVKIELGEPLPKGTALGAKLGSLIEVGELKDVVFFARPADARPNSEMALFVIDQDGQFARRTKVRFGVQSGPLIEIISGLSPGDRVIVTDTSKWVSHERIRLK